MKIVFTSLLSVVAGRRIDVLLPFKGLTKGEIVATLNSDGLRELARSTVSCASYPLRQQTRKSCGLCAACIFRRVALHAADIDEVADAYQHDVLELRSTAPMKKMNYLRAFLNQIDSLVETDQGRLPTIITNHLRRTGLIKQGESEKDYIDLYRKYRREWLDFAAKAKRNGCEWANQMDLPAA
ncbi:MAG: 7-cyano-7-deazaguanine synthase [Planctomycetales bacterium]